MSTSRHGASEPNTLTTRITPPVKKLSKISKKLAIKKERLIPMHDLPLDALPVDCPPIYEVSNSFSIACYIKKKKKNFTASKSFR